MKYLNFTKQFAVLAIVALFVTSCSKVKSVEPLGDTGRTFIKAVPGGAADVPPISNFAVDFVNTTQALGTADIRRDAANAADLNKTVNVTIIDDTMALRIYNDTLIANGETAYEYLPAAWYTVDPSNPRVGIEGGSYTLTFAPGEFAKQIRIHIPDATVLDPSTQYAIAFRIVSADNDALVSGNNTVIAVIGAKNIYDGVYSYVSGLTTRYLTPGPTTPAGDAFSGPLGPDNPDIDLVTVGANTVEFHGHNNTTPVGLTWSGGTSGVAGIDGLRATVDPATNLVTMTSELTPSLVNWAGHINSYDPATQTFHVSFHWVSSTNFYREYEVVLTYSGPR